MKKTLITLMTVLIAVSAASAVPVKTAALASEGLIDLFADEAKIELSFDMENLQQVDESAVISGELTNNCLYWALGLEIDGSSEVPVAATEDGYGTSSGLNFVLTGFMPASGVTVEEANSSFVALSNSGTWFRPLAARKVFDGLGLEGAGIVNVYGYTGGDIGYLGSFEVVPEPSMLALFGIGGLFLSRRRKA